MAHVLFRAGYFSDVVGVVLHDGRRVVVKIRTAAPRSAACAHVQEASRVAGFPAPELLIPPVPFAGGREASAELLVEPAGGRGAVQASADLLAWQIRVAPSVPSGALAPAPAWVRWSHDEPGLWPTPDDREVDLNSQSVDWLDEAAAAARDVLVSCGEEPVVGHVDWVPQNVWWHVDGRPLAVHDWDSLAVLPEPAVAGVAAGIYVDGATVEDSWDFLEAYQAAAGRWTRAQARVAWAAGLWTRLFDAKKDLLAGRGTGISEEQAALRLSRLAR